MPPAQSLPREPSRRPDRCPAGAARRGWLGVMLLLLLGSRIVAAAEESVSKEYQLKAAFLYNFTKFVEWSPERFADETSPIVIGVLGENPFGDELVNLVRGRKVHNRAILVKTLAAVTEASSVHLLFVPAPEEKLLGPAMAALRAAGVLTVGESSQFFAHGGVINFTLAEDKVRFEINQTAGESSGLKISAQLLKLATVVRRQP